MVKKTSILDKLKTRWKSSSGVRVDAARTGTPAQSGGDAPANRLAEEPAPLAKPMPERIPGRKLSPQQDAMVAMGERFQELSSLVRGVHTRMEGQGEQTRSLADDVKALPALGQAQLELLRQMAVQLEQQNAASGKLMTSLASLPDALKGVQGALDRSAATDDRTAKTLGDFRQTMDRIQGAMEKVVTSTDRQAGAAEALVDQQGQGQEGLVEALREGTKHDMDALREANAESLQALKKMQNEQSTQLDKLSKDGFRFGNAVVVLLALTFFALCGVGALLVLR